MKASNTCIATDEPLDFCYINFVCFFLIRFNIPVHRFSVMLGWSHHFLGINQYNQDPVVQSIVSLTISLRHKFVKQISAKVTNTLLFFVEKM